MHGRILTGVVVAVGLLTPLSGCAPRESSEQQIRALIASAEQSAKGRRAAELRGHISEQYRDEEGRDKRALDGVIRLTVLRHESIHLLTRVAEISFPSVERARAVVYVAMAGQPLADGGEIARLTADLHRFDLVFVREGSEWKVVDARWYRAEPADFLK